MKFAIAAPDLLEDYEGIDEQLIQDDIANNPKGWLISGDGLTVGEGIGFEVKKVYEIEEAK